MDYGNGLGGMGMGGLGMIDPMDIKLEGLNGNGNNSGGGGGGGAQRKTVKISKEIDMILCDYVERHPPLWNPEDKNYHKSEKREELFEGLANAVQIPGTTLKERWGAIRHTFTKNVRKVEYSRHGPNNDPLYKPQWPLFEKCLFLYEIVRRNLIKIQNNKLKQEAAANGTTVSLHNTLLMDNPFDTSMSFKAEEYEPCSSSLQLNTPEDSSSYAPLTTLDDDDDMDRLNNGPPAKRRARDREDSTENVQFLHPSDVIGNMACDGPIDESETFGRLVIAKLKKLNENDAADAQIEILQVMKKYLKPAQQKSVVQQQSTPQHNQQQQQRNSSQSPDSDDDDDKSSDSDQILS